MSDRIEGIFSTPEMLAVFSAESHAERILDFEAALAQAVAQAGVIPQSAVGPITVACRVESFDVPGLY